MSRFESSRPSQTVRQPDPSFVMTGSQVVERLYRSAGLKPPPWFALGQLRERELSTLAYLAFFFVRPGWEPSHSQQNSAGVLFEDFPVECAFSRIRIKCSHTKPPWSL